MEVFPLAHACTRNWVLTTEVIAGANFVKEFVSECVSETDA